MADAINTHERRKRMIKRILILATLSIGMAVAECPPGGVGGVTAGCGAAEPPLILIVEGMVIVLPVVAAVVWGT